MTNKKPLYILKEGDGIQKQYLITTLCNYSDFALIESIIKMAIEHIDKSKGNFRVILLDNLIHLSQKIKDSQWRSAHIDTMYDHILIHIFKHIVNEEKIISNEYISGLNEILNTGIKLGNISKDIINFSTSLGKFGQNSINRKFSVYFCVVTLRLLQTINEDIFKRLLLLGEDSERSIRYEISYHLRYIFSVIKEYVKDVNEKKQKMESIVGIVKNYFSDNDILMRSLLIESLIINIECFEEEFIQYLHKQIILLFNYDQNCLVGDDLNNIIKVFETLINKLNEIKSNKVFNHYKVLIEGVKVYLEKYIYFEKIKKFEYDYIFPLFEKIGNLFELSGNYELTEKLFRFIYSENIEVIYNNSENNFFNSTNDNFMQTLESKSLKIKYRILFYENLHLILSNLKNETITKKVLDNIFYFIIKDNIFDDNEDEVNEMNLTNNEIKNEIHIFFQKILKIFEILTKKENFDFFDNFIFSYEKVCQLVKNFLTTSYEYKLMNNFLEAQIISINYIFLTMNNYENYFSKVITFCKIWLRPNVSCEINKKIIELLVTLIKFSTQRNEIISYFKKEFYLNKAYYSRRLYVIFIIHAFKILSYQFVKDKKILENAKFMLENDIDIIKEKLDKIEQLKNYNGNNKDDERKKKEEETINEKEIKILENLKKEEDYYFKPFKNGKNKIKKNNKSAKNVSTVFNSNKKNNNTLNNKFEKISKIKTKKRESENNISFLPKELFSPISPNKSPPFQITKSKKI